MDEMTVGMVATTVVSEYLTAATKLAVLVVVTPGSIGVLHRTPKR